MFSVFFAISLNYRDRIAFSSLPTYHACYSQFIRFLPTVLFRICRVNCFKSAIIGGEETRKTICKRWYTLDFSLSRKIRSPELTFGRLSELIISLRRKARIGLQYRLATRECSARTITSVHGDLKIKRYIAIHSAKCLRDWFNIIYSLSA